MEALDKINVASFMGITPREAGHRDKITQFHLKTGQPYVSRYKKPEPKIEGGKTFDTFRGCCKG